MNDSEVPTRDGEGQMMQCPIDDPEVVEDLIVPEYTRHEKTG